MMNRVGIVAAVVAALVIGVTIGRSTAPAGELSEPAPSQTIVEERVPQDCADAVEALLVGLRQNVLEDRKVARSAKRIARSAGLADDRRTRNAALDLAFAIRYARLWWHDHESQARGCYEVSSS